MISRETVLQVLKCGSNEYPKVLEESFPHVLNKIVNLWYSPDADAYFTDLLQPNGRRGGRVERKGFPEKASKEISRLNQLYRKPRFKPGR